jgi:hypothetical protein
LNRSKRKVASQLLRQQQLLRTFADLAIAWHVKQANYWRRLVWPALGWAFAGLLVLVARPSRLTPLLSGSIEWRPMAALAAFSLLFGLAVAALHDWSTRRPSPRFIWLAVIAGWAWTLFAGGGGVGLLLLRGPWPPTNGWFALMSGISACPLTGRLLRNSAGLKVSGWLQFGLAVMLVAAGRIALVVWPQPNPL